MLEVLEVSRSTGDTFLDGVTVRGGRGEEVRRVEAGDVSEVCRRRVGFDKCTEGSVAADVNTLAPLERCRGEARLR